MQGGHLAALTHRQAQPPGALACRLDPQNELTMLGVESAIAFGAHRSSTSAAFNDAVNKVAALTQEKLGGLASGMNLPPGFKLPF